MNWNLFFSAAGAITIALACLAICLIASSIVIDKATEMWDRWVWTHREIAHRDIGKKIVHEAYWFSENISAMNALLAVGEELRDGDGSRISGAKEVWYAKNDKSKREEARKKPI